VTFEGLKLLTLDEDEERIDLDAKLRLGADHLEVVDETTKVHAVAYTQIIGLFYSRGKDPRWTTPEGRSTAVMKGGGGPMSFMRPTRDWVTIRTAAAFFPLRVPAEDLQRVTSALEARTGLKVSTAK
jgi:hypothetical protein